MKRRKVNAAAEVKNRANALKQEEKNRREKEFEDKRSDKAKKFTKKD